MTKSSNVAFIFARGGSKGVPRKNIKLLAGKPLIAYAIETAKQSELVHHVFVSTDDEEIATVAKDYGAEVPFMRPAEFARDDTPEWEAWRHAAKSLDNIEGLGAINAWVTVPTTSPFSSSEDIDACITKLLEGDADIVITVKKTDRNPFYNMVMLDEDGSVRLACPPEKPIHRRQDAPAVYDMTTVAYATRPEFILRANYMFEGKMQAVVVPEERGVEIDTHLDFEWVDYLMRRENRS
jgi:N,N'-diacetyl-8-epilegionaminate cytidylyltransferase